MAALRYNIQLDQGSDYQLVWPVVNAAGQAQSLSGWSGALQVRSNPTSEDTLVDLTGRLVLSGSNVTLTVPGNVSSDWEWRTGIYDLELTSNTGVVTRVCQGRFTVSAEVTR